MSVSIAVAGASSPKGSPGYGTFKNTDSDDERIRAVDAVASDSDHENEYRKVEVLGGECSACSAKLKPGQLVFTYCGNWDHPVHKRCKKLWDLEKANCAICRQVKPRKFKATAGVLPSCVPSCITCVGLVVFAGIGALIALRVMHKL